MIIRREWQIHVTTQANDEEFDGPFVEIEDAGIEEADEVRLRSGGRAWKFNDSQVTGASIWTREGIELLHEATGAYLRMCEEREEE